jgi:hypothetical protein
MGAPPARTDFSVAWDAQRERVVMFGGTGPANTVVSETWEFDGAAWSLRNPVHRPPARKAASMAFDPVRQRVLLFGGLGATMLGDVWEWDGVDWRALSNSGAPSARYDVPMVWDSTGAQLLMLGGAAGTMMEAWSWNGTWAEITLTMPPAAPRFILPAAEDPVRHTIVAIEPVSFNVMATWEFTPAGWTARRPTVSPGTAAFPLQGAAWDPVAGQVLLSGIGQTWVFLP